MGKKLPSATYLHVEALHDIPQSLATLLETLKGKLNLGEEYNIIKLGTQPAQLLYRYYGDMACQRINAAITRAHIGETMITPLFIRKEIPSTQGWKPLIKKEEVKQMMKEVDFACRHSLKNQNSTTRRPHPSCKSSPIELATWVLLCYSFVKKPATPLHDAQLGRYFFARCLLSPYSHREPHCPSQSPQSMTGYIAESPLPTRHVHPLHHRFRQGR